FSIITLAEPPEGFPQCLHKSELKVDHHIQNSLCGSQPTPRREFIRAVIFTCGGSRWRRSVGDSALIGEETFDLWKTNPIPQLTSEQDPAESQPWREQTMEVASVAAGFGRSARLPVSEEVLEALRSADRKGRDVVVGLSNACCKWGCSKSEISSLC
uniref:Insulin-like domain-containing protein n=1 Tax=Amphiprion ocellaris TaxID=80972 RepID=A0AAQ5XMP6_AMPOC